MADGQEKSDDLIAELAKLMASTPGPEPTPKPGPRLASIDNAPKVDPVPRPVTPTIRIPGMDRVVPPTAAPANSSAPKDQAAPVQSPASPSQGAAPRPGAIRIPGMDRPAQPQPAAPANGGSVPSNRPASSLSFGAMPPAATIRPEPMSNWQEREIPKPVPVRPVPVDGPAVKAESADEAVDEAPPAEMAKARAPEVRPPVAASPAEVVETEPEAPPVEVVDDATPAEAGETAAKASDIAKPAEPAPAEPELKAANSDAPAAEAPSPVVADEAKARADANAAALENVDFDFGFGGKPPAAKPVEVAATPKPAVSVPADPIAALISAELDEAEQTPVAAAPVEAARPQAPRPAPRSFAAPDRGVTLTPVRSVPGSRPMPSGPVARARPPAESDRFTVAPVFTEDRKTIADEADAAPAKPAATASVPVDPIDEIESLIGEAVRVGLSTPARSEAKPPAPIVPPLNSGFAPRKAAIKESEPETEAAEAAILAAAAASGVEIGRNGGPAVDPNPYRRRTAPLRTERRPSRLGQYIAAGVAAILMLAAGFGVYWVFGLGQPPSSEAPVLTADASPDKAAPPASSSAPTATEADGSVVFNQMSGSTQPPEAEALVSRDDSQTSVADVATPVGNDDGDSSEGGLANRKVRTVTVRPDGTIVSGDDAVAGSEALPVDRPNVPDLPGADVQRSDLLAAIPDGSSTDPIAAAIDEVAPPASGDAGSADSTEVAALVEPDSTASINTSLVAPVPMPRPTDRASLATTASISQSSSQTVADTTPVNLLPSAAPSTAVTSGGGAAAYVQLSSQKSQADAQASLNRIKAKWNSLFQGQSLEIQRADLGTKGVYYRVRLPASSLQDATEICASIKANGGECFATNG